MAMEATHVRFARDLAPRLSVTDRTTYYSGAVYPDSRYVTGIPRMATHGEGCPRDPFAPGLSDFEKGWATHLLYDERAALEKRTALTIIPNEFRDDDWAFATAVKLIEDMESIRQLGDEIGLIRFVTTTICPLRENPDTMESYYQDLRKAYETQADGIDGYAAFSIKIGIAPARVERMIGLAKAFAADPNTVSAIHSIYNSVHRSILSHYAD
jgi:hypothetical protein